MGVRAIAAALALLISACSGGQTSGTSSRPAATRPAAAPVTTSAQPPTSAAASADPAVPRFAHIVVVIEENHASSQILGNTSAPYMNQLARSGMRLANSYGVRHPSQPNYVALFSGSTHGLTDDSCPHTFGGANLGSQLLAHHLTFAGYSQSLPSTGFLGCSFFSKYARKHAPWTDFSNLPRTVGKPMTAFPADYTRLPTVSFVVPDLEHDMHDGTVAQADSWLHTNLGRYVTWARTHNSLLVLTWDEDDSSSSNHILGVLTGAHVRTGSVYQPRVDHCTMLRTLEAAYGLPALGTAAQRTPITAEWTP